MQLSLPLLVGHDHPPPVRHAHLDGQPGAGLAHLQPELGAEHAVDEDVDGRVEGEQEVAAVGQQVGPTGEGLHPDAGQEEGTRMKKVCSMSIPCRAQPIMMPHVNKFQQNSEKSFPPSPLAAL